MSGSSPSRARLARALAIVGVLCFLIGIVIEMSQTRANLSPMWRYFLATGILGGYTTFSTFSLETALLYERGELFLAALYVLAVRTHRALLDHQSISSLTLGLKTVAELLLWSCTRSGPWVPAPIK